MARQTGDTNGLHGPASGSNIGILATRNRRDRAGRGGDAPADEARRRYTEMNFEQATLSSNSLHIVVEVADHNSLVNKWEHATSAIDAIRQVVDAVRHQRPLSE
jgi:hypothetical protein